MKDFYLVHVNFNLLFFFFILQKKEIPRFAGTAPNATTTGEVENMVMYAGEGVGKIHEILPAREVIMKAVQGARLVFP